MLANATAIGSSTASSQHPKNHIYLVGCGYLYTSPCTVTGATTGFAATSILSLRGEPFVAIVEGSSNYYQAITTKPMVERTLHAENVPTIHVGISPNHRSYRRFRAIARPGCLAIERSAYQEQNAALEEAYHGQLSVEDATRLFEAIVSVSVSFLPNARRADSRIEHALEMLQENPSYPLKDLACAVGLSYDRMSYLFAETIGLPLRSYLLWQKLHKVASLLGCGKTLTEIALAAGFTDSAHLSNTYQKTYGITPSYFLKSDCVEIHSLCLQATVSAVA